MQKSMSNELVLKCQNLSIGHTLAIKKDLDFNLSPKKILLVNGKNGSGKSTLIKTLLKKISPINGDFKWNVSENSISYLPQITNPNSSFSYTINEILDLYSTTKEIREKLPINLRQKKWINCSGGEKQKAMLITRLGPETKVLILDEPFNHLDDKSIKEFVNLLTSLVKEKHLSILLVSHMKVDIPKDILDVLELN